jgi:hypothetical protein
MSDRKQLHRAESFLRSLQVLSYAQTSPHFMKHEGSLPHSQQPAICSYPELHRSSPWPPPPSHFSKIHFIIIPFTPGSSEWSPSLRFSNQNPACTSLPHTCYMPCHLFIRYLITRIMIVNKYRIKLLPCWFDYLIIGVHPLAVLQKEGNCIKTKRFRQQLVMLYVHHT